MMKDNDYKDFWDMIKILNNNNVLEHIIVIGSWAEYLYGQAGILKDFIPNLRTLDIDFLIENIRKPSPKINITQQLKNEGYIIDEDLLSGTTIIFTPGLMEIEFLVPQKGSGLKSVLATNLGVNAQALRHLSIIKDNIIIVNVMGFTIKVPSPEAYILHKAIINNERKEKARKDKEAIVNLIPYINGEELKTQYSKLTKKQQKNIADFSWKYPEVNLTKICT